MPKQTGTFDIEFGLLNKGYVDEIKRMAFKYGLDCKVVAGGGFLSTNYTFRIASDENSTCTITQFYQAVKRTFSDVHATNQ